MFSVLPIGTAALGPHWWELFLIGIPFLTSTEIGLGSRTRDAAPPEGWSASCWFAVWRVVPIIRIGAFRY